MKRNKSTCSPWLHARHGEQLGLSPRSSDRVGGLSAGAERTRRSVKGARLFGRDNRKQNSDPSSCRELSGVRQGAFLPSRYRATSRSRFASDDERISKLEQVRKSHRSETPRESSHEGTPDLQTFGNAQCVRIFPSDKRSGTHEKSRPEL